MFLERLGAQFRFDFLPGKTFIFKRYGLQLCKVFGIDTFLGQSLIGDEDPGIVEEHLQILALQIFGKVEL